MKVKLWATGFSRGLSPYGFPLWGKLSPQVTDEGVLAGHLPPHPARKRATFSPREKALSSDIKQKGPYRDIAWISCFMGHGILPRTKQSPTGALLAHCGAPPCSNPLSSDIKQKGHTGTRYGLLFYGPRGIRTPTQAVMRITKILKSRFSCATVTNSIGARTRGISYYDGVFSPIS